MEKRIEIEYCTKCNFLLRAGWLAQELLHTFGQELDEVALIPGEGGVFKVRTENNKLFSRSEMGRFPEIKEVKQLIRDTYFPDKNLGHSDR